MNIIKLTLIFLLLAIKVEAQGYRDPNVAIYEAMRPLLEGQNYVPPQRIIIQQERIAPIYEQRYIPIYTQDEHKDAERKLNEALKELNRLPEK